MTTAVVARRARPPEGVDRLLLGIHPERPLTLREHHDRFGPPPETVDLLALVERAGLRGRGGAAFDTAVKLRGLAGRRGAVVVANGVEGEPASGKDSVLMRHAPHLVLDGVVAAARAVGAREVVVAVSQRARAERAALEGALAERRGRTTVRVAAVPGGFVGGEETAVLSALDGRNGKPSLKPPFPVERGLHGAPTLVQNVETLAHLALIARFGDRWFRSVGSTAAPGTALTTVSGSVRRPGVLELELGATLGDALRAAGGLSRPLSAVLVGGYFGRWVPAEAVAAFRLTPDVLGAGAIVALPQDACGLAECARVVRYLADASAGQCGPCVHGLAAVADAFERLLGANRREHQVLRERLVRWSDQIRGRGACRHPDGALGFVASALATFEAELSRHGAGTPCRASGRWVLPIPPAAR
jgi:NADH:ubiquinone oxidoreductase subunit F (NADH-binding)